MIYEWFLRIETGFETNRNHPCYIIKNNYFLQDNLKLPDIMKIYYWWKAVQGR